MKNKTMRQSIKCAIHGIIYAFKTEKNYKYYGVIALIVLGLNRWLGATTMEYCLYIMLVCGVLAMECMNTAVEHIANAISQTYHEQIGIAKDLAAGSVLLSGIAFIVIEGIVLIKKL